MWGVWRMMAAAVLVAVAVAAASQTTAAPAPDQPKQGEPQTAQPGEEGKAVVIVSVVTNGTNARVNSTTIAGGKANATSQGERANAASKGAKAKATTKGSESSAQASENTGVGAAAAKGAVLKGAYYINLDQDTKRRANMEQELAKSGLIFERVPGVTVSEIRAGKFSHLFPEGVKNSEAADDSATARSWASDIAHRRAYELVAQQPEGLYLVLEDDVRFTDGWQDKFALAWPRIPSDWALARIGFWGKSSDADKVNDHWFRATRPAGKFDKDNAFYYGAHAVVLSPERARAAVDKMIKRVASFADVFTADGVIGPSYVTTTRLVSPTSEFGSSRATGEPHLTNAGQK